MGWSWSAILRPESLLVAGNSPFPAKPVSSWAQKASGWGGVVVVARHVGCAWRRHVSCEVAADGRLAEGAVAM